MRDTILLPSDTLTSELEKAKYSAKVGSIMYAMVETRIDIAFATSMVSRFANNPSSEHFHAVDQILRYLAGSQDRGITFGGEEELNLVGYSDSDWAGDRADRKSTSGFVFTLNGGPVSYASKKQAVVALSSTEAEYVALSLAAREATWLRLLLTELGLLTPSDQFAEIHIHEHNKCAEAILSPDSMLHPAPILYQIQPLPMDQIQPLSTKKDLLWLHLPRAPGVVMTTSVLLGWWMLGSLWSGWWSCLYTHLGGRHKRARPRLPSHPHHIPITFPISHLPTTYVATPIFYQN